MSTAVAETGEMARLEIRKGVDGRLAVGGLELVACRREVGKIDERRAPIRLLGRTQLPQVEVFTEAREAEPASVRTNVQPVRG